MKRKYIYKVVKMQWYKVGWKQDDESGKETSKLNIQRLV